ncbi:hypothetical protein [Micrococcus sp. TA1]|nr:hypothetical protein [Micrococcus sp. TA1]MBB5750146.1 hypothetical protein [Micrococcus sp. TA1]HRO31653.1 hypothetical protein [Citricoccus sp.]
MTSMSAFLRGRVGERWMGHVEGPVAVQPMIRPVPWNGQGPGVPVV